MAFNLNDWKGIDKLITQSQPVIRDLMESHFRKIDHDLERKAEEIKWFLNIFRFITRKWNVEILYELEFHNGLIFNDLKRHLGGVSSRTLSDCLKQLQEYNLITRELLDTRPPSVMYNLNEEGKGFVELSMILVFYLAKNQKKE